MDSQRYKSGDPMNPYDPACFSLGKEGVEARIKNGTSPLFGKQMEKVLSDPSKMKLFLDMMKADMEECKRTGEDPIERMMREKREWAEADAKSAKLKNFGNEAFKKGDYEDAFVIYTACQELSPQEPLYSLNRAAAALKLKLFEIAIDDASSALDSKYNEAKAHFRRGQAYGALGELQKARKDLEAALKFQPEDSSITREMESLARVEELSPGERSAWIDQQGDRDIPNIFGSEEEFNARVTELIK
ncbi:serine threonine-protein phosphatase 5 [Moniliophthora roreri MCA 2997]|uniref:Serine threonine-protein phosphatase 5 n=2 Tax=Moniliophthora roreri TaxID=221103 RepID=V2Z0K2_MONRO|nr:serine threonine-protein phosphatase 5 [Moniliophthora roreri MCA 2997]KAI3596709.1 serine threonine-protein phosphatase 5 [Moniliophthora roreri]